MQNTDYGKQRTENSHEVRFCYEFDKVKYCEGILGVVQKKAIEASRCRLRPRFFQTRSKSSARQAVILKFTP